MSEQKSSIPQKIGAVLFGIFLCLVLMELVTRAGYFMFNSLQDRRNRAAMDQKNTVCVLCLGDSMTALGGQDSWPRQLEKVLNETSNNSKYTVINKGRVEANTAYMAEHFTEFIEQYRPRAVVMMTGINEAGVLFYRGISGQDSALFKRFKSYKVMRLIWHHLTSGGEQFSPPENMYTNPATRHNFAMMSRAARERGITTVVVQYPMRPLTPLRELFDAADGMLFVGNEQNFKQVLAGEPYETLFKDRFGGDFGHCTARGNLLVARAVSEAIMKEAQ